MEFRSRTDEAWYNVRVEAEEGGDKVRVRFVEFPDNDDDVFSMNDFADQPELASFAGRFRPLSIQLQDSQCRQATNGLLVCASFQFLPDDLRFYDALIHQVDRGKHLVGAVPAGEEEECDCTFILSWLHGPNVGSLTRESLAQICRVQFKAEIDPVIASFVIRVREKFESPSAKRTKTGQAPIRIDHVLNFSHHLKEETRRIEWKFSDESWSTWTFGYPREKFCEDADCGGDTNHYLIVIENLEKDLTPSVMMDFLRSEASVLAQAFVLPSLSTETCTRGNVLVDSGAKFTTLCNFLENPQQIVVSAMGRPWVMTEKMPVHSSVRASWETLTLVSQNIIEKRSNGNINRLKVVRQGSDQFNVANNLKNLYKDFSEQQIRLHKRLIVDEGKIWMKHSAERRVGTS